MGLAILKNIAIRLSDIWNINDGKHIDAYLCSTKHLWEPDGLKEVAANGLPVNFRVVQHGNINFSASGIFTTKQLENAIEQKIPDGKRVFVIDLLREYHGFIEYGDNAIPIAFRGKYNVVNFGVNYRDISSFEGEIFSAMNRKYESSTGKIISWFSSSEGAVGEVYQTVKIKNYKGFATEENLVNHIRESNNIELFYKRLPCTDHSALPYQALIEFSNFMQNEFNPETDWLHIHCHGGKGRSTSLSLVFDMFRRLEDSKLKEISFNELLSLHKNSGGKDLNIGNTDDWKQQLSNDRYTFLNKIYDNLVKIQEEGLKSIFSTALHIVLLGDKGLLHTKTLEEIINSSGDIVQERIMNDYGLYNKLSILYEYSLENQTFAEDDDFMSMDLEYDPEDIMFQQNNDVF
jgi:hypothetical protein